jgi:hypothetical protein
LTKASWTASAAASPSPNATVSDATTGPYVSVKNASKSCPSVISKTIRLVAVGVAVMTQAAGLASVSEISWSHSSPSVAVRVTSLTRT